jgi:hypothetical protein
MPSDSSGLVVKGRRKLRLRVAADRGTDNIRLVRQVVVVEVACLKEILNDRLSEP